MSTEQKPDSNLNNSEKSREEISGDAPPQTECQKLIEAKTAVILLKNSRLCTKNEYTQWLLKMIYQPYARKDTEAMNVLYLSRSRRKIWATDFAINQDPSRPDVNRHKDQLYVITPKTSIMTLTQENRLVYILDLSSSLATVGNTRSDILLSEVFLTLRNSLEGLVQPFSMQVSQTEKAVVQPLLRLTVMADCSQFASNVNVIPMLAEHPTMRVFIQNVVITANNIHTVIRQLKADFLTFQEDTSQFRKFMKRNRQNTGYNLDVGNEVGPPGSVSVLDATSMSKQKAATKSFSVDSTPAMKSEESKKRPTMKTSFSDMDVKNRNTSYYSSTLKKEVWGIGKSGANLSRILHAGHFALELLPPHGRAQLILITDGAMKSNVHDNTFVRQFAEEDITCHIIQIGYVSSFIPGRNFGFVPDTEILQFLARATNGTFMYSEKCMSKNRGITLMFDSEDANSPPNSATTTTSKNEKSFPIVQFVNLNKAKHIQTPNIYHRQFLFRETILARYHHSELRVQAEKDSAPQLNRRDMSSSKLMETNNDLLKERFNFPWDPYARAPEGEWRLLKYREYILPAEFSHIIAARAREGFTVQSITFDDGTGSKHVESGIHDLEAVDFTTVRKERIQIVMIMRWQPNVSIEYRIRATWLPTIIGNSLNSYKSEDILMSSGIFSRAKAPRAEIFVRTDASFAHMLQNWDVIKRRAQMMGLVTGSTYFGEAYAAPVYSKIEKLKSYLVDIFEGDEVLKTVIGFPNKFWMNVSSNGDSNGGSVAYSFRQDAKNVNPMANRLSLVQQKAQFIDSFKNFWMRINNSEARSRTRCWYDPGCIDLLVGDVSPYMAPKLSSSYNQGFVLNVADDILLMVDNVKSVLRQWADFEAEDGTFVRMMQRMVSSPGATNNIDDQGKDYFSTSLGNPPSFCELRLRHEYGRLITLRLLFFNVEVVCRKRAIQYLIHSIKTDENTKASCNMVCERPFSCMLMRDPKHFADYAANTSNDSSIDKENSQINSTKSQNRAKTWYLPVAMWLTGEYIVRDYLRRMTWSWQTDNYQDDYHRENKMMPIHDLAFQFLCQARLDQGYQLVSPRPDSTQFYQEIVLPSRDEKEASLCAIQYFVWKDSTTGKITTELWMEPSGNFDYDQYDLVKRWTFEPDRKTISQLVTFDQIHAIGRSKGVGDFKTKKKGSYGLTCLPDEDTAVMLLPQLFDVASVLRSNKFVVASFQSPQYKIAFLPPSQQQQQQQHLLPQQVRQKPLTIHQEESQQEGSDQSGSTTPIIRNRTLPHTKTHRYLRRHAHSAINVDTTDAVPNLTDSNHKMFSFRPDQLLNMNKEVIAKLDVVLQNYALLHYFVERSLDYISNGEILMSHHDVGATFWQDLRGSLQSAAKEGKISSTCLIPDLRKTRCFVKVFDPRSFVVILFPSLDSVSSGLLKFQEEDESNSISTVERCRYLDIFMFECVRQKPMKPTKTGLLFDSPLEYSNRCRIENVIEDAGSVSIRPIDYLIHESDGLGVMLRPELFEGEYSTCQSQAQLTERILRVAQNIASFYSRSFLKSFYTCLMRGFMVDDDDLVKVLEVCNESSMEIEITEFVNTMTMQNRGSIDCDVQVAEVEGKFNLIFNHYFEAVQTKNGSISNLFYYKPPFNRQAQHDPRQEHMSADEKISYLVDLVAHSQSPLLIRLYASYNITDSGDHTSELVVPITSIPTSYSDLPVGGKEFNVEETSVLKSEAFPSKSDNTSVCLQIVCLSMPRSDIDDYTLTDNLYSYSSNRRLQSMQNQPDCFSSLSRDQQTALAETDSRINMLLKEETIHNLLKSPVITLSTLRYVEKELCSPDLHVDYQTSIKLPFQFVKKYSESRRIFMDELQKDSCCRKPGKYQLKRVDDYFYVCKDSMYNIGEEASYSNNASPIVPEQFPRRTQEGNHEETVNIDENDFCDGLGISLSKFLQKDDMVEKEELEQDENTPIDKRPLYWLILIPHERYIQIYFYSKLPLLIIGSDIMNPIKEKIKEIQERTNRLVLLNDLQETRICSKYLEAPMDPLNGITYSDEDESEEDTSSVEVLDMLNNPVATLKFTPGQFSCPIVYKKRFPLHWRLQPNVSLKFLTTDVLRLFTVVNRPNMFVIERDNSIVYCKIYEEVLDTGGEGSPGTIYGSPTNTLSGKNAEDDAKTLVATDSTPKRELTRISSTSPRPRASSGARPLSNEKRDVVLEVYGIDLPAWVEKEFVNMIENRLISQITLNEIQQFFARNSTSKPTAADVEFILPTSKAPTHKEILRVPSLVNSPHILLQYFKQSLLADNIRSFTGPYVRKAIERHYNNVFFSEESFAVQDGSKRQQKSQTEKTQEIPTGAFCFYYNCTKRLLGASTPLELLAGQGIAGICLTLLDESGVPVTSIKEESKSGANFDPEVIRHCLEEEFREATAGPTYYHIWVDIWVTGSVDGSALMQHIYECYRQSLCDYFIEKTVTIDLGASLSIDGALQRAVFDKSAGRLGTVLRKKFIETVLFILRKATELKSPTVHSMDRAIQTTPWCMDDLVRYLDVELRSIDPSLRPTVAWTSLDNTVWGNSDDMIMTECKWELYRGFQYRQRQKLQSNIRLVAISGLDEFVEKLGSVSEMFGNERRPSAASENDSQNARSRRSSAESANTDGGSSIRRFRGETQDQSRASRAVSTSGLLNKHGPKLDPKKHCFMIMDLDVSKLSIYAYNWSETLSHELFNGIFHIANRQEARSEIMTNILHQKMGLFHHAEPIKTVIEKFGTSGDFNSTKSLSNNLMSTTTNFSVSTPHIQLTSPSTPKKSNRQVDTTNKADVTPVLRTPGRRNNNNTTNNTTTTNISSSNNNNGTIATVASILDLKDMISFPTTAPSRDQLDNSSKPSRSGEGNASPRTLQIEQENNIDRILQKSSIKNVELDHALMDSIADSVADTVRSKDFDILRRHGQPFLETFLRHAKLQSAHRKALKVYLKWRKRYGDPQAETELAERLSRPEVSTIMRSSRVLHFCRTPLIFCDPEKDWSGLQDGSSAKVVVVEWFKNMASALMSEYAAYLEGADMQLIDFSKSNSMTNSNENTLRPSKFSLGKHMTADCPPTFLLRVSEGGSIICEVRLTSVFVSVTLYTLHRQYGRLDYSRFRHETRAKKRINFKKFEENSGHFKQVIHINSFVYDFQLHYIQKTLDDPENLPADLDILSFIRRFARIHDLPSPYSKDRIIHGFYDFNVSSIHPKDFFGNLFKNAPRHGLVNIPVNKGYPAVSISSYDLSFGSNSLITAAKSSWKYTLVICSADDSLSNGNSKQNDGSLPPVTSSKIIIEYFVLVVYQGQITPESMTKASWVKKDRSTRQFKNLDDVSLPEENCTLADIVSSARHRLDCIVSEVLFRSKISRDWSTLYSTDLSMKDNVKTVPEHPELVQLMSEFDRVDITEADQSLAKVFKMKLDWNAALNTVKRLMKSSSKDFHEGGRRHLLLYSARYMDFMIHLRIDSGENIQGWIVSREKRTDKTAFEGAEREQMISLGRIFYYYIWMTIAGRRCIF